MTHSPILLKDISLSFSHKTCFTEFNFQILPGCKIAIIGPNGCGKSTLLRCIQGSHPPTSGKVQIPNNLKVGYVPQIIEDFSTFSGGQRFNKALSLALTNSPNLLILDEPTNHLDTQNRISLFKFLKNYSGTLIAASHDADFLNENFDLIWHIEHSVISVFKGKYGDYQQALIQKRAYLEKEVRLLKDQKNDLHQALMKEQTRARKSREKGEKNIDNRKWPTIVSKEKANRATTSSGSNKRTIEEKKQVCLDSLSDLPIRKIIKPQFSLLASQIKDGAIATIQNGSIGYENVMIKHGISFTISARTRMSITGNNGCGKTTLIKAIINDKTITKTGKWILPKREEIGFLDQHYNNLDKNKNAFQTIAEIRLKWSEKEIRRFLADFIFRSHEEVNTSIDKLSGGEKARLSLAQIAASTPRLLILDEITNNLDIKTKQHVIDVVREYPGALIVISHDEAFLQAIHIEDVLSLD